MLNVVMLSVVILSVVMLSVVMLSVVMLSVVMLNVVMMSVVVPFLAVTFRRNTKELFLKGKDKYHCCPYLKPCLHCRNRGKLECFKVQNIIFRSLKCTRLVQFSI
jgi:hypothetical protein